MRLTSTPNNRNPRLLRDPFSLPLDNRLFYARWVDQFYFLGLAVFFALLFLGGPDLFYLVDVDDRWLVRLCTLHNHSNHFITILPRSHVQISRLHRAHVKYQRARLRSNSLRHHGFTGAIRPVEEDGADIGGVSFSNQFGA